MIGGCDWRPPHRREAIAPGLQVREADRVSQATIGAPSVQPTVKKSGAVHAAAPRQKLASHNRTERAPAEGSSKMAHPLTSHPASLAFIQYSTTPPPPSPT